jgi:hypothetical protein
VENKYEMNGTQKRKRKRRVKELVLIGKSILTKKLKWL